MTSDTDIARVKPRPIRNAWWTGGKMLPENAHVEVIGHHPESNAIRIRRGKLEYICCASEVTYVKPVATRETIARLTPYAEAIKSGLSVDQMAKQFQKPVVAITAIWKAVKRRGMV